MVGVKVSAAFSRCGGRQGEEGSWGGRLELISAGQYMGHVQEPAEARHLVRGQADDASGSGKMADDVPLGSPRNRGETAFSVSLPKSTADEIATYWETLSRGSTVVQPLAPSEWAPLHRTLKDPFGIIWVVDGVSAYSASRRHRTTGTARR